MAKQNHTLTLPESQLNTNPDLSSLSDEALCQCFINFHCQGNTESARPFLAALIARYDTPTPDSEATGNRPFFAALAALAKGRGNRG